MMERHDLEALVSSAPSEDLPRLIGDLEAAKARAWARLMTPSTNGRGEQHAPEPDTWLAPEQAASIAGVKVRRIYEWAVGQRWASRPTKRTLRISEAGFRRWLATR